MTASYQSQTASGLPILISARDYCGTIALHAEIPGRVKGSASSPSPLQSPRDGATHGMRIGFGATGATAGLTESEAAKVTAWVAELQAALDSTPERQLEKLLGKRRDLQAALTGALEEADSIRVRAWEHADECGGVTANRWDTQAELDRKALADFDSAHPEVLAEIERERKESIARGMWD